MVISSGKLARLHKKRKLDMAKETSRKKPNHF